MWWGLNLETFDSKPSPLSINQSCTLPYLQWQFTPANNLLNKWIEQHILCLKLQRLNIKMKYVNSTSILCNCIFIVTVESFLHEGEDGHLKDILKSLEDSTEVIIHENKINRYQNKILYISSLKHDLYWT